jgi:hypothetical protein
MQIMKVAANLHLLSTAPTAPTANTLQAANLLNSVNTATTANATAIIKNDCIEAAIKIVHDLIEHQFSMLADKGLAGKNAAHDAVMRMFDKSKTLTDRQIVKSRCCVSPFKDMTGSKAEFIRVTLLELVEIGMLRQFGSGASAEYTFIPTATTATTANKPQPSNLLDSATTAIPTAIPTATILH